MSASARALLRRASSSSRLRTLARLAEITGIVAREGFSCLAEISSRRLGRRGPGEPVVPARLRDLLAELGATFIKLGQVLSTRPDLVPPAYERALSSLQDAAPAVAFAEIRRVIERELGDPDTSYAFLSPVPLAAASIGQVHAARLHSGDEVVVKVRRPGVVDRIELDLAILGYLARLFSLLPGPTRRLDLVGFVEEFAETIRAETDYLAEGANADRVRAHLSALGVHVPRVVWESTTAAVLTLERIYGAKIDDLGALEAMGVDRQRLAASFAEAYLSMVFRLGFFHADPHPGNLFVEAGGRVALVDYGMMGTVSPEVRRALVEILFALSTRDERGSARALGKLGVVPSDVDEAEFSRELAALTSATVDVALKELRLAPLLGQLMVVSRRHRLRFPRTLALLVKTVVMCEGVAAQLDPDFSLALVIASFVGEDFGPTAPTTALGG